MFQSKDVPEFIDELNSLSDQLIEKQTQLVNLKTLLTQLTILGQLKFNSNLISLEIDSSFDYNSIQNKCYKFKLYLNYSKLTNLDPKYWTMVVKIFSNEVNGKKVGWIKSYSLIIPSQVIFISIQEDTFNNLKPPFYFQIEFTVFSTLDESKQPASASIALKEHQVSFLDFLNLPSSNSSNSLALTSVLNIFQVTCEILCDLKPEENLCCQFLKFFLPFKLKSHIKMIDNNCASIDLLFSNEPIRLSIRKQENCKFVEVKIESNHLSILSLFRISIISMIKDPDCYSISNVQIVESASDRLQEYLNILINNKNEMDLEKLVNLFKLSRTNISEKLPII